MVATDVEIPFSNGQTLPTSFRLFQNYPNPFNRTTVIDYQLPMHNAQLTVSLKIFNVMGEEIIRLVSEEQSAGSYRVEWHGKDEEGKEVASGIYFYQLRWGSENLVRKMLFMK